MAAATTYYISPNGNDVNGNGTSSAPWATLSYACRRVTTAGDIIHVNSGTFTESSQAYLAAGVSIEGAGASSSIIHSHITTSGSFFLMLHSNGENTNGNQHIAYVTFDGGATTAYGGVSVLNRGNVSVHDCVFRDFLATAIQFNDGGEVPTTRASGNQFYNNTITNCSMYSGIGHGGLRVGGQQGMLIHDNNMSQTGRASGTNGYVIKYGGFGWNRGLKIYNNTITKEAYDGVTFDFAIELSHEEGTEIYNNTITGSLDVNFITKGTSEYGIYVHHNNFGPAASSSRMECGVIMEFNVEAAVIKNNYFKNLGTVVLFSTRAGYNLKNFTFANNICTNIGVVNSQSGQPIRFIAVDSPETTSDGYYIYNNIFIARKESYVNWGLSVPSMAGSTNNVIRNNIIENFISGAISANPASTVGGLVISNNILYGNGNNNNPYFAGGTPSNYSISSNIVADPKFVSSSDFHLLPGSPAIGAGYNVNLGTDYDGTTYNSNPSIGVYEYNPPAIPAYQSSVIENASSDKLDITFNISLAGTVPSTSAFSVFVNSVARTVNGVSVSGNKVRLSLASPVVYGNTVTVAYNKPSSNPLQTVAGGVADSFAAKTVTNNVQAIIIPEFTAAAVEYAAPSNIELTYNTNLAAVIPSAASFSATVNSVTRSISSVAISGTKVIVSLSTPVVFGDLVTIAYSKPSSNPIQTPSGGQAASLAAQSVNNKVQSTAISAYLNSAIGNSSPSIIFIYYSVSLANQVPAPSAFTVTVNSQTWPVRTVSISGNSVILVLNIEVVYGDIITVAYTKPASESLVSTAGLQLVSMPAQPVANKVQPVGPVFVGAVIKDLNPGIIEVEYNEILDLTSPEVSAFAVKVNLNSREVTAVLISDNKVYLTLSGPVQYGDIVTVSYLQPSVNPLKKASGGVAVSIGPELVKNNVADKTTNTIKRASITVYPNPTSQYINISRLQDLPNTQTIRIISFSGKLCMEKRIEANTTEVRIPIGDLKSDSYILQVMSGPVILSTHKVIVTNIR